MNWRHPDWQYLLSTYGYLAVFIGTFLEGESILVIAGFFANRGLLSLPYVIAAAFFGSFSGDQLFFLIGRVHGKKLLAKYPRMEARVHKVFRLFERWHTVYILGFRFLYGLRTLSPFVLAPPMSKPAASLFSMALALSRGPRLLRRPAMFLAMCSSE